MRQLFQELKRRNVYKVAVTYAAVAFVTLQAAQLIFPATTLEGLYDKLVVLAVVGFPISLVLAWAFELTPEGVRWTSEEAGQAEETGSMSPEERRDQKSRLAMKALVGLGLVGAAIVGGWYLKGGGGESAPETRAGDRSIAVLPFDALGESEPGTFTEGMHDALLTRLSNISGLTVISRTAVQQFRDTALTTRQVADSLGVRWVMEGGVQEMDDQIQVNAQLIDPRTESHAWAESYRRDLTAEDLFDLQSEITKKIARSLEAELTPEESDRVERQPTESLEAYRLYVRGRSSLYQRTESGTDRALTYFRRAIERDSSYSLAWAGLADALLLRAQYGYRRSGEGEVNAAEAARRALALDSTLAEAHTSCGFAVAEGFDELRSYRRAIELKPSYPQAYHWLASEEIRLGRLDSAVIHLEQAAELDPTAAVLRGALSAGYLFSGRDSAALQAIRRAVELAPDLGAAHLAEGFTLTEVGRHEEALAAFDRGFERVAEASVWRSVMEGWPAIVHARLGHRARAEQMAASLAGEDDGALKRSLLCLALGDTARAASALEGANPAKWVWSYVGIFRYGSSMDPLRGTPEYRAALRKLNTSLGLRPDGSQPDSVDVPLGPPSR